MIVTRFRQIHSRAISAWLRALADEVDRLAPGPPVAGTLFLLSNGKAYMNLVALTADQAGDFNAVPSFVDAHGNPATPDTTPTFATTDDSIASVADNGDGTAVVTVTGTLGQCIVSCSEEETDAEGAGVSTVTCEVSITVTAGDAVSGDIALNPV